MQYKTEELIPIVAKLAEKYTAKESTSITYEKAQQLMGAVIYCICEYEAAQKQSFVQNICFLKKSIIQKITYSQKQKLLSKKERCILRKQKSHHLHMVPAYT